MRRLTPAADHLQGELLKNGNTRAVTALAMDAARGLKAEVVDIAPPLWNSKSRAPCCHIAYEWMEGHYLEPATEFGFWSLKAVREARHGL